MYLHIQIMFLNLGNTFTSGSQTIIHILHQYQLMIIFQNGGGGTTLLVTRVTSGSFTKATSTNLPNGISTGVISTEKNKKMNY